MKQHGKVRISAFVGLGLAAALSVAVAHAELATSTTTVACGRVLSDYRSTIGPVPWGWSDSCDRSDSTALGSYEALSDILTGFGPALPKVGSVDAAASVNAIGAGFGMPGEFVGGEAEAFGSVTFYFTVEEYRTPPATFTPITYIEANGQAAFEGSTSAPTGFNYEGSAGALAILPDGTQWRIEGEISDPESSWFDEFSRSIYLDLPPNDPLVDPFYTVTIAAGCYAGAWAGGVFTSWAECNAVVDPIIRFGQEAFDARYGPDSFPLSDYYRLVFSENVPTAPPNPMPLPSSMALFAAGLLGLMLSRRRRR